MSAFIMFFSLSTLLAQGNFVTQINPNPVTQGERFSINYILDTDGRNFVPPSFKGIKILAGPNQSSSTRIINGRMSRQLSFSYTAVANTVGVINIPGASIVAGNERLQSQSVNLTVLEPSAAQKRQREEAANRERQLNQQAEQIIKDNLYITVDVSKRKVYKGEQLVATYKLYVNSELNVIALDPSSNPSFTGFWTQDFDQDMNKWKSERINNAVFKTLVIKKVVLVPTRSGSLSIDPMSFDSKVRLRTGRSRSMFDDFFSRGSYKDFDYTISSPKVSITSSELPSGAPSSFNGAVGDFQMEAFFDKTEVPADESLALKINITGNGNLKLLDAPMVNFPPDFEVFDPKVADNVSVTTSGSKGNMQFEYLAIPRNAGNFKIQPVEFSYFDLKTEQYKTLTSEAFNLKITKSESGGTEIFSSNKENLEILSSDINYIKTDIGSQDNGKGFFGSFLFILLSLLPLVGIFFLFIAGKKRKDKDDDYIESRKRTASKVAKKRLAEAQKHLKSNDNDNFYIEINRALWGYLSEKLEIPVADLTFAIAESKLRQRGISDELILNTKELIDQSEMARYAPSAVSANTQEVYSKAKDTIITLEESLK